MTYGCYLSNTFIAFLMIQRQTVFDCNKARDIFVLYSHDCFIFRIVMLIWYYRMRQLIWVWCQSG
jgi:hypothetical protein